MDKEFTHVALEYELVVTFRKTVSKNERRDFVNEVIEGLNVLADDVELMLTGEVKFNADVD